MCIKLKQLCASRGFEAFGFVLTTQSLGSGLPGNSAQGRSRKPNISQTLQASVNRSKVKDFRNSVLQADEAKVEMLIHQAHQHEQLRPSVSAVQQPSSSTDSELKLNTKLSITEKHKQVFSHFSPFLMTTDFSPKYLKLLAYFAF